MSYRDSRHELLTVLQCIKGMTSIAKAIAEQEGWKTDTELYLKYVIENAEYSEDFDDWHPSDY